MSKILVVYGTTEGQTRKIAEYIGEQLRRRGHVADVIDSTSEAARQEQTGYDGVILGASLHQGKHQASLTHFVKDHLDGLNRLPSAFFSVSLGILSKAEAERKEAQHLAQRFVEDTGLRAGLVRCIAGALLYTQYDWIKRAVMKWISRHEGRDADTSHDHEYTDWNDVMAFVDEFLARLPASSTPAAR